MKFSFFSSEKSLYMYVAWASFRDVTINMTPLVFAMITAPSNYPTFVKVIPKTDHSVTVTWRGVSTKAGEASLLGYIVSTAFLVVV